MKNRGPGRPKQQPGAARSEKVIVRLRPDELTAFDAASELAGLGRSTWMRERLRRVAQTELQKAGRPVAFDPPRGGRSGA